MGFFMTLALERDYSGYSEMRLLVATGFLGSYTTFSTYGLDTITAITVLFHLYFLLGSALIGILSVQLGVVLGWELTKKAGAGQLV